MYTSKFKFRSFTSDISSVEEVLLQMMDIDEELKKTDMDNLRAFNSTYYIITKNVLDRVGSLYFEDDEMMVRFDVHFAKYYFYALKQYVETGITTPAWQKCFDVCMSDKYYKFLYMVLGINAHVNNDVALVLRDLSLSETYLHDYNLVNPVIYHGINEVVYSLEEHNRFLETFETKTLLLYKIFLGVIIKNWRKNAWENYLNIQNILINEDDIKDKASKIADEIIKTGSLDFKQNLHVYSDLFAGNYIKTNL